MAQLNPSNSGIEKKNSHWLVFFILLAMVILLGVYFRLVGINWGENQYLHPDERFLVWVGSDISPVKSLGEYFDTQNSSLNPHNRGHGFFVYGTLPLFIARYLVEWIFGNSGFNEMTIVGRPLSALADFLTLILVILVAAKVYNRRVAILAGALYASAVLPIQLSHFYKEDTFTNFFTFLTIYFGVCILMERREEPGERLVSRNELDERSSVQADLNEEIIISWKRNVRRFTSSPYFLFSLGFGMALGCAVSSKLNAAPVALVLPAAFGLRLPGKPKAAEDEAHKGKRWVVVLLYLILAALVSLLVFRVFQPYAFTGPGFFGLKPNPQWVANIREQRVQSAGDVDFPPALQWARRPVWFSGKNLVVWGLGLPFGVLAWAGFLWAGWRILKGEWQRHALLWGWTALYFTWQSLAFNPTMRYQLPIYPALAVFAAWVVFDVGRGTKDERQRTEDQSGEPSPDRSSLVSRWWLPALAGLVGGFVLLATLAWAFAFTRIYTLPVTRVAAARWIYQNIPGPVNLHIETGSEIYNQPLPFSEGNQIMPDQPFTTIFDAKVSGEVREIYLAHVLDQAALSEPKTLELAVNRMGEDTLLATASLTSDFLARDDQRGDSYSFTFSKPFILEKEQQYRLTIQLKSGSGVIVLAGAAPAHESSWDDGLPLRLDGYDGYGGIYQPGLNFEMYWDDNAEKLDRFITTLNQADYIFITSNRQWGTTTRVPERYPLTIAFYRNLLGCPQAQDVIWCYNVAGVGNFKGSLGFDLVQVFESYPEIGPIRVNDQFAEEAFTVYDHPKVFIFKKSADYTSQRLTEILTAVDLSQVVHVTPRKAGSHPANLMLPADRWAEQQQGGTWSEIFNTGALHNRFPFYGVLVWYLSVILLGWLVYPLMRVSLPGLPDRGYPLARTAGLLLLSYLVWLAGSFRIPVGRLTISLVLLLMALVGGILAFRTRKEIAQELRERRKYFLAVEILFLAFFIFDLLIRWGNPDLWHPWKGGEKPMDFAYFNAVLKSTTFPPFDPWYAGGYLNYYYYGFVFVGMLVKWLGIVPSVAYNLILPTVFSLVALGAFSIGWNLIASRQNHNDLGQSAIRNSKFITGLSAALGMAVLGNLGIVRMIFQGYQKVAAPGGVIEGVWFLQRWVWAVLGFVKVLTGTPLPYSIGDWYWNPSRVIPALNDVEPITEFPFFTVLYGDPHAHLYALPISLLALAFVLAIVLGKGRWKGALGGILWFFFTGLSIGALKPTNTWDVYTYLALGCVAAAYGLWSGSLSKDKEEITPTARLRLLKSLPEVNRRILFMIVGVALLVGLSLATFYPYTKWYGLGYSQFYIWQGSRTPMSSYLTHWGLFLFLIVSWMVWETREWMASTPASALRKLAPYKDLILGLLAVLALVVIVLMVWLRVGIAWFVLPAAAWAGVLILRPGQADGKRFVLFLVGTGLMLTLMVEIIALRGDVGRMNTVFKFYLQVWTFFAVSAAASFGWLLADLSAWLPRWRTPWIIVLALLVATAGLYPVVGGLAKIQDRMEPRAPHTLDGMAFMAYAQYVDEWGEMDLSQDYRAIRWMQENVQGSPVIVEANLRNLYHWGSRFSIYTGLPGVVGWEWHQQQQRALLPSSWVSQRIDEIDQFYLTEDLQSAQAFLRKYQVRYIILGQQERGHYPGPGLDKFVDADSVLWREVYRDANTSIYEVIGM